MGKEIKIVNARGKVLYGRVIALMATHGYKDAEGWTKKDAEAAVTWWNKNNNKIRARMTADGLWVTQGD